MWKNTYFAEDASRIPVLDVDNGEYHIIQGSSFDIATSDTMVILLPKLRLNIICKDASYIQSEDKPQYTLSQLISQVGGDLGLNTV